MRVGDAQMLGAIRHIMKQDFRYDLPVILRREAIKESNTTPTLVRDEFILHVLQQHGCAFCARRMHTEP